MITLAPVFAWLWIRLGVAQPSSPAKFAIALLLPELELLPHRLRLDALRTAAVQVSPWWLIGVYLLHALGELSLSPVGLSMVTKLAPARILGFIMGIWFLTNALGNFTAGSVAGFFDRLPLPQLFGAVGLVILAATVVLAILVKPIRGLMSGVR